MVKRFKQWLLRWLLQRCTDPAMWNFADVSHARHVELYVTNGKIWVNADGECRLRGVSVAELVVNYHGVVVQHWQF